MIPGEYFISDTPIIANQGRKTVKVQVKNTGDRPIQVGSHTHFFEVNKALEFPRSDAYGFHLNIPSGTSVRFEPGDVRSVELTEYSGKRIVWGFSGLVNGQLDEKRKEAFDAAKRRGFRGA
jgi:urease subunit beta